MSTSENRMPMAEGPEPSIEGGYVVELTIGELHRYKCPVCRRLLRHPVQASCGDRFCNSCVAHLFRSSDSPTCPVDFVKLDKNTMFRDVFAEREIESLEVNCSSRTARTMKSCRDKVCDWKGELRMLKEHEATCRFVDVVCEKCLSRISRNCLFHHQQEECSKRIVKCHLCGLTMPADTIEIHTKDQCEESLVQCPNSCRAGTISRKEINRHLAACPLQHVSCFYHQVGCQFRGPRKDLPPHHTADIAFHLQQTFQHFQAAQTTVHDLVRDNTALKEKVTSLEDKVDALTEQLQQLIQSCAANVETSTAAKRQERCTSSGSQDTAAVKSSKSSDTAAGIEAARSKDLVELNQRLTSIERVTATHDLQICEINIRQDLSDIKMDSGVLVWKISEFSRRLAEARSGKAISLYSPPFRSSPCGYKMCARLYPNGDGVGRGTHLSLFFVILQGEFDSLLSWPFQQKVSLCLLDQSTTMPRNIVETFRPDPTSSSFSRPKAEMNVASGCPLFFSQSSLSERYCKDDTVFVKVIIHADNLCAPDNLHI